MRPRPTRPGERSVRGLTDPWKISSRLKSTARAEERSVADMRAESQTISNVAQYNVSEARASVTVE